MRRIISFSVWGDQHAYTAGAVENAKLAPRIYPGWTTRFYCDTQVPDDVIKALKDYGGEVIRKPRSDDFMGLYWRFEAVYDSPDVERMIVRDTDSRLNMREADAVQEWIESDLPFHIMRDNPAHNIAILGGMWGAKAFIIPEWQRLQQEWIAKIKPDAANPRGKFHGTDQHFLCEIIWKYVKSCHIAHDDIFKFGGNEQPFRVKLKRDGYVGMIYSDKDADRCEAESTIIPRTICCVERRH